MRNLNLDEKADYSYLQIRRYLGIIISLYDSTASSKEDLKIFIFILETYIFFKFEHSVDVALEEAFSYCLALITNFKLVFTQQYRTEKIRN